MKKQTGILLAGILIAAITGLACTRKIINGAAQKSVVGSIDGIPDAGIDYRNFYGISWRGTAKENLTYARQMKYSHLFYQKNMEYDTLSNGLYFYLETPEYLFYNRQIDLTKTYSAQQRHFYETNFALKDTAGGFPGKLATGWFFSNTLFTPVLDFQQQRVITWAIDSILGIAEAIEARNPAFHFGGIAWDVPQPSGDFWSGVQSPGRQVTLAYWTGGDYGIKHPDVTHDYATYSEGHLQFYKQLYKRARTAHPGAGFIMEPYNIYTNWINLIKSRSDAAAVTPDILCQESFGTGFVDKDSLFLSGLITKDRVASTTPNTVSDQDNRLLAAKAAVNGAWFSWFGRFGGTGNMPDYASIKDVPARLKLIRVLANWENINRTPLSQRSWNGAVYQSSNAFASPDIVSVLQPGTRKLFVVFLTAAGEVTIPAGKRVSAVYRTNDYFIETVKGGSDMIDSTATLKLNDADNKGKGYIVQLTD